MSSHGVRQVCPKEVLTSAPGGSDSNRNASVGGDELRKFRLGIVAEHAATVKPHATTAITRLMIGPPPLERHAAALPPQYPKREGTA